MTKKYHKIAQYHESLHPKIWANGRLDSTVQARLLKIARLFVDNLNVSKFKIIDIILTGSMANYNYNKFSDFDLHIITDFSELACDDIAEEFYSAKKSLWNDRHNITIYGHDVELYVEDVNNPPVASGMYSLLKDKWIIEPVKKRPDIDGDTVDRKTEIVIDTIQRVLNDGDRKNIKRTLARLYKMRRAGLSKYGEFSVENLVFKIVRNLGYLDELRNSLRASKDEKLSLNENLNEVKMSPGALKKFGASESAAGMTAGFEAELIFPKYNWVQGTDVNAGINRNHSGSSKTSNDLIKSFIEETGGFGFGAEIKLEKPFDYSKWTFTKDTSLDSDVGYEIVSPVMSLQQCGEVLPKFFDWAKKAGATASSDTGFHMSVAMPNHDSEKLDYIKMALFLGDEYVLNQFRRVNNRFTKPAINLIKNKLTEYPEDTIKYLNTLRIKTNDFIESTIIQSEGFGKHVSINPKEKYVEVRSAGNTNYIDDIQKLQNTLLRYAYALNLAMNPEAEKEEYLKKLHSFLYKSIDNLNPNSKIEHGISDSIDVLVNALAAENDKVVSMIRRYGTKTVKNKKVKITLFDSNGDVINDGIIVEIPFYLENLRKMPSELRKTLFGHTIDVMELPNISSDIANYIQNATDITLHAKISNAVSTAYSDDPDKIDEIVAFRMDLI